MQNNKEFNFVGARLIRKVLDVLEQAIILIIAYQFIKRIDGFIDPKILEYMTILF